MSKKILAFGASSSRQSINKKLATYAASQIEDGEVTLLDLNDFEMAIYSIDKEKETGIPALANQFKQHILDTDGIIISFAEHNSSFSAAYKNIYDWLSRLKQSVWEDKPMLLLSTSPGGRGAKGVLGSAMATYGRSNLNPISSFSLPSFYTHFDEEKGIIDEELAMQFQTALTAFEDALKNVVLDEA